MIINSHVHVNTDENYFFYNDYVLKRLLTEIEQNGIDMAFPCLNPKIGIFRCPNDCSMTCTFTVLGASSQPTVNNNLNNCKCEHPKRHRVCVTEDGGKLILRCRTCGKLILETTIDPLRRYNLDLINLCRAYRHSIKPLIYVSLCTATIQAEINFFEKYFADDFVGFKLHPWNDQVSVANFKFHSSKPVLIHTGMRELESAKNAVIFAAQNPEIKTVIAHAATLDEEVLKKIATMENVYIDCCPSSFMYDSKDSSLFYPEEILSPEDIYYKALDFLPSGKILFGTDSPWGNSENELAVVRNLKIPESVREQILFKNARDVYLS